MAGEAAVSGGSAAPAGGGAPVPGASGGDGKAPVGGVTKGPPGVMKREPVVEKKGATTAPNAPPAADAKGDAKPEAKPEPKLDWPRKVKHTINGKTVEHTFSSPEEFEEVTQRWAADVALARSRQNEVERAWKALQDAKKDPTKRAQILKEMFPDFDPRTETIQQLQREYELEQMDPKDRELATLKERLDAMERERQAAEQERQRQEQAAADAAAEAEVEQEVMAALDELRPHFDQEFMGEAALYVIDVLREAAARGETLTAKQAAMRVRRMEEARESRVEKRKAEKFKSTRGQDLLDMLSQYDPAIVDEVVKAHLERNAPREIPLTQVKPPEPPPKPIRGDDEERLEVMGVRYRGAPRL